MEKVKWRMAPLLSGDQLLQADPIEAATDPFGQAVTQEIIDLISAALNSVGIGSNKKGKKTTLIRDTAIALLKFLGGKTSLTLNCSSGKMSSFSVV